MPSLSLSVAMRSAACMRSKVALSIAILSICIVLALRGIELARQVALGGFELGEKLRRDGEQIAAGELGDFADVAEAGAHDDGLVAEFLEVVVDARDRLHAGIVGALDSPCRCLSCTSRGCGRRRAR